MKANPGGNVDPKNVIGRESFIDRFWKTLDQMSVIVVAERRMGKTSIINKMKAEPQANILMLGEDVEGVSRASEFVERVANSIFSNLSKGNQTKVMFSTLWHSLGGSEIAGVLKLPDAKQTDWKVHLTKIITDLASHREERIVFFWDEFPWMLQKIGRNEGPATVADLIDTLRALRQKHLNLRMIFTGSIGLHHVISGLNREGYANSPLNDMRIIEVPPLSPVDAITLATALLKGEHLTCSTQAAVAEQIASDVDGMPFFIHHVVASLADRGELVTPTTVKEIVTGALLDPQDPWKFEHYRSRLKEYYSDKASLVRSILDILALQGPLSLEHLLEQAKLKDPGSNETTRRILAEDREAFRELIKLMSRDHYLRRNEQGDYTFSFDLIRRWWQLEM